MSFKKYLSEANKQYDFIIKVAGELPENFEDRMETALKNWMKWTDSKMRVAKIKKAFDIMKQKA